MPPELQSIDHIHVFVADRTAAEAWYARVFGWKRIAALEHWSADGGPLTIANAANTIHIALFERPRQRCRSTIALGCSARDFLAWRTHLASVLERSIDVVDHGLSWSMYFEDPDGNPYEITTYDYADVTASRRAQA